MHIDQLRNRLKLISDCLDGTLNELLQQFTPDEYMSEQLEAYIPEWGDRSVQKFVEGVMNVGAGDEPDIWNGEMCPFNILFALDLICSENE